MTIVAAAINAARVLLVPKSLTFQIPVSNGAGVAVEEILMTVDTTPSTAAIAAMTASTSRGRRRNPVRGRFSSAAYHAGCSGAEYSPVTSGRGGGGGGMTGRTPVGLVSVVAGPSADHERFGGAGTDTISRVSSDVAPSAWRLRRSSVVSADRMSGLIAGTSPVTSEIPRSDWPHSMQNFCPGWTSVPHDGHCMTSEPTRGGSEADATTRSPATIRTWTISIGCSGIGTRPTAVTE